MRSGPIKAIRRGLVSVGAAGILAGATLAAPAGAQIKLPEGGGCGRVCWAHYIEFRGGSHFMTWYRVAKNEPAVRRKFNWKTDGCSTKPWMHFMTKVRDRQFRPACLIHDFAYKNFGWPRLHVERVYLTSYQRGWDIHGDRIYADYRFRQNMYAVCRRIYGWGTVGRWGCDRAADLYFHAVESHFGKEAWDNDHDRS